MSIKDLLLQEAQNINTSVELDSIFESVQLTEDVKTKFSAVFETVVKAKAVELAETHIKQIAESADAKIEEAATELSEANVAKLNDTVTKYFDHLVETWMEENKLAVENGIKVQMFDSLMGTLKEAFVEHNVTIPEESVDVVAEMEEELREAQEELNAMLTKNTELKESIDSMKRENIIGEAVSGLSDVQKERVCTLVEGLAFDNAFGGKVSAIVEMVSAKRAPAETSISENANPNFVGTGEPEIEPETTINENQVDVEPVVPNPVQKYMNFL